MHRDEAKMPHLVYWYRIYLCGMAKATPKQPIMNSFNGNSANETGVTCGCKEFLVHLQCSWRRWYTIYFWSPQVPGAEFSFLGAANTVAPVC